MRTLLCSALLCLMGQACAIEDGRESTSDDALRGAVDPDEFVHARVRFPDGFRASVLSDEGSGLLWELHEDDVGEPGWWLVYLTPSTLDSLARAEGIEWRSLPPGFVIERTGVGSGGFALARYETSGRWTTRG